MKKVVSISLVIALLMFCLLLLSSGTARANETVASPHFLATATPAPPRSIPTTGGEADLSGAILLIGAGVLLVAGGLVIHERRRTRA